MKAKAITFGGSCKGCGRSAVERGGVEVNFHELDFDLSGEWLCLRCARRLAKAIEQAADDCVRKMRHGLVQRHGRWVKK
jgi:hypothetical protein